jgi:hypothetical protein
MSSALTAVAARTLSRAAAVRVTAVYAVFLITISEDLTERGPRARGLIVSDLSTNLHNLAHGQLGTLVGSAFVSDSGDIYMWLPGLVCLLALGELIWRSSGLLTTFAIGHIGATLLVALWLAAAVEAQWLPHSVTRATDVGISYGAVCVLGALTASIPTRWRPVWIGWWLGIAVVAAWWADFTAIGHVLALVLGMGLSLRLRSGVGWTPLRMVLLCVAVVFGYGLLAGSWAQAPVAGLAGALVALLASRALWRRNGSDRAGLSPGEQ